MPVLLETLGRVLVPLVTPFDDRDELNTDALASLVNYIIDQDHADTLGDLREIVDGIPQGMQAIEELRSSIEVNKAAVEDEDGKVEEASKELEDGLNETQELMKKLEDLSQFPGQARVISGLGESDMFQ